MKRGNWILLALSAAVALTVYLATVKAGPATAPPAADAPPLCRWLALSPAQQQEVTQTDPTYDADAAALSAKVSTERNALAGMFDGAGASDAEILAQVDRVSAAENALQRRTTQYVLRIRHDLTTQQQLNLMGLCAQAVRDQGYGRGMGRGMGGQGMAGNGRGLRYRGGRGTQ